MNLKMDFTHLLILDSCETVHHSLVLVSSCNSLVGILRKEKCTLKTTKWQPENVKLLQTIKQGFKAGLPFGWTTRNQGSLLLAFKKALTAEAGVNKIKLFHDLLYCFADNNQNVSTTKPC